MCFWCHECLVSVDSRGLVTVSRRRVGGLTAKQKEDPPKTPEVILQDTEQIVSHQNVKTRLLCRKNLKQKYKNYRMCSDHFIEAESALNIKASW